MKTEITIPSDNDGFVLFQCVLCGEYFKITPADYKDEGVLELHCPNCALISDNYFTEDVVNLATAMAHNYAMGLMYSEMKKWEREFKGGMIAFKVEKKPTEHESPVSATVDALSVLNYKCCGRKVKIKPMFHIIGSYCPFCGVKTFEAE